jgi:hypothetical protein
MLKKKKPRPLTKKERAQIPHVSYESLLNVFGEPGRTRAWLREQQKEISAALPPEVRVEVESKDALHKAEKRSLTARLREVMSQRSRLQKDLEAVLLMRQYVQPREIVIGKKKTAEAALTAVVQASDWHAEEPVKPEMVNHLNEFNLDIFKERAKWFFINTVKLLKKQGGEQLQNVVLHLGGDFFSNNIHEDLAESNLLGQMDAVILVQETLIGGIQYMLDNTSVNMTIVCSVGNHSRTTQKRRIQTERENSLEYYMYYNLARELKSPRIKWIPPAGYHTYVKIYDLLARIHHGHQINYGGGVGGITIPVNKAIAQWNKGRVADIDFFGHFHQYFDGGNFVCNGSLIGHSPFAIAIKAGYEPPRQALTLINSKHGKAGSFPIFLEEA